MATPLFPTFEKRVNDSVNDLIAAQVTPWSFLMAGPPFQVKRFNGREISYQGVTFDGSPQQVFWSGYIEPFLEDLVVRELDFAVMACKEYKVDAGIVLSELQGLLLSGCNKVFARMADVDRRLRGKGSPSSVPLRPIQGEQDRMATFIQTHVSASLKLWESSLREDYPPKVKEHWINAWYSRNQGWAWAIGSLIAVIALAITLWLGLREKLQGKPPAPVTTPRPGLSGEKKVEPQKPTGKVATDPLQSSVDEFKSYDLAEPGVDVGIEKIDDPKYMAVWRRKIRMLNSIEDTAKKLHRVNEVEAFIKLKNNISIETINGPVQFNLPTGTKPVR